MTASARRWRTTGIAVAALIAGGFAALAPLAASAKKSTAFCSRSNIAAYLEKEGSTVINGKRVKKVVDIKRFYEELLKEVDRTGRMRQYRQSANSAARYAGTDALIKVWNESYHLNDPRLFAYVLASAWHETATRMSPVRETLASTDEQAIRRLQAHWVKRGRRGHYYWGVVKETGKAYFGRGHIQLTWADNYKKADARLGRTTKASDSDEQKARSYYWNPDNVLDAEDSAYITFDGMMNGWYRAGRCLPLFIKAGRKADYRGARDIVNGDVGKNGTLIARYAQVYETALLAEGVVVPEEVLVATIAEREKEAEADKVAMAAEEAKEVADQAAEVRQERRRDSTTNRVGKIEADVVALERRLDKLDKPAPVEPQQEQDAGQQALEQRLSEIVAAEEAEEKAKAEAAAEAEAREEAQAGVVVEMQKRIDKLAVDAQTQASAENERFSALEDDMRELLIQANATREAVVALQGAVQARNQEVDLLRKQLELQSQELEDIRKCTGIWSSIFGCDTGE